MNWERRPLGDVADFCLGKMLDQKKNRGELLPYLANVNVRWGEFDLANLRQMRFESHEMERYGLRYGDIVMCEGGEPGRCAIWKEQLPGMMVQKALHRIRPHECLDHRFLFYFFLHKGRTGGLAALFTGSTIKHLPRQNLAKVEIDIPPLPVQKGIASILSAYDDLVENNRRRSRLLERASKLLYREWFVHLRFPGHEHVKVIDGVPQGWASRPIGELLAAHIGGGWGQEEPTGSETDPAHVIRGTDIQSVKQGDFSNVGLRYHKETALRSRTLADGDIVFEVSGGSASQAVGRTLLITDRILEFFEEPVICASFCKRLTPRSRIFSDYLESFIRHSRESGDLLVFQKQSASALQNFNFAAFLKHQIIKVPPDDLLSHFHELKETIAHQAAVLSGQVFAANQARDLLLPRLMNGEIAV